MSLATAVCLLTVAASAQASLGTWERAWGMDVNGGGVFGICTVAASCFDGDPGVLGGEFDEPTAVAADGAGNVYVAEAGNRRIQKFDAAGNFQLAWGRDVVDDVPAFTGFEICTVAADCKAGIAGTAGGELSIPTGVATDPAGNVYVADPQNHRIQRFSSAGDFQLTWGKDVDNIAAGTGFEVCTVPVNCKGGDVGDKGGEFNFPNAVATDAAGNVYVGENTNNRVQKLDSAGNFQLALGKDVIDDGPGNTDFEICTAPATCKVGENGALGGEFLIPAAVAADNAGHVYVAEGNNRIQRFDSAGNFQRAWGKDVDNIAGGTGFEVCTLRANCKVGEQGGLGGEFGSIEGVATDARGHVYVSDTNNNRVQRFDSAGGFQRTWGKDVVNDAPANTGFEICTAPLSCQGGGQAGLGGEFVLPAGLAADGPGNVYVADNLNDRVQKFTAGPPDPPASVPTGPTGPIATGQRARALKKCKKKRSKAARKKCRKRANRLPV